MVTSKWLRLLTAVAAMAMVASACSSETTTTGATQAPEECTPETATGPINAMLWEGYSDEPMIEEFTANTGIEMNVTYIGTNDEVFAKIRTKSGQFDLVPATTDVSMQYVDAGLVQPLNMDAIPNSQKLFPNFQNLPQATKDGQTYGIAHTWSADPILYNADVVQDPPASYEVLFDAAYAGKVALYDDLGSLWVGALVEGFDPFNMDDAQLATVVERMQQQQPLVRKYWSTGNDLVNLFESGEVVIATGWSYMYTQLKADGVNVERLVPEEGNLGWVDTLMVPVNAEHACAAQLWIDWAVSGKGGSYTAKASGYSISNPEVAEYLTEEEVADLHMDDPSFVDSIVLWEPVDRPKYQDAWNQVKGG